MSDGEADHPALGPAAAAALAAFLADRQAAADADPHAPDYGLSQFWYTGGTADAVARAVVAAVGPAGRVACVSCPSLFKSLLRLERGGGEATEGGGSGGGGDGGDGAADPLPPASTSDPPGPSPPPSRHALLEFDARFAGLGPFSLYDYRDPLTFAPAFAGAFDAVVADPPYLSSECLERTGLTVAALEKKDRGGGLKPVRVLLSGAAVRGAAWRALGLKPVTFRPEHSCKLGNEFLCYTDCESVAASLGGWDGELGPEEEGREGV